MLLGREHNENSLFGLVYRTALVLAKSNTFFYFFAFIFVRAPNATSFLLVTIPPYHQRFIRNHDSMNRGRRFLGRASAGTVVFEHSPGKHASSYRPRSEIHIQENIYVVSLHYFSVVVSINKGIN